MVPSVACSGHGDVAIVPMLNPAAVTVADIFCADAKREARAGRVPSVGNGKRRAAERSICRSLNAFGQRSKNIVR